MGHILLEGTCLLPHHDSFGHSWVSQLEGLPADTLLIGIDEQTGVIDDGPEGSWRVYGRGAVTLYRNGRPIRRFDRGQSFQTRPRTTPRLAGAGS
jgi:cyanophycinase